MTDITDVTDIMDITDIIDVTDITGPQIASPVGARSGFERASPVCPVLPQSGQRPHGFERGPHRQPAQARTSPYKSRLGPVRDMHGQIWTHYHGLILGKPVRDSFGLEYHGLSPGQPGRGPAGNQQG